MKIQQAKQGAVTIFRPEGPLIEVDVADFRKQLTDSLRASLGRVVVDLSAVPFVDSRGLETMLDVTDELSKSGRSLKLCGTNKTVRQVLELTELSSQFDHFEDVNSAVRSFL